MWGSASADTDNPAGTYRRRGHRSDGHHHRWNAARPEQLDGAIHRRRRGENHRVGPSGRLHRLGAGIPGHRPVGDDFVDLPSLGPEPGGQPASNRLGPREQHGADGSRGAAGFTVPGPPRCRKGVGQGLGQGHGRDQVGDDTGLGQGGRRPGAHRGPPDTVGDRSPSDPGEEPACRVGRGEGHPLYAPDTNRRAASARAAPASTGSSMAMTGSSITVAPRRSSRSTKLPDWTRARVTTMLLPASGRPVTGAPGGRRAGGAARPGAVSRLGTAARRPEAQRGHGPDDDGGGRRQIDGGQPVEGRAHHTLALVAPQCTTATGVSGERPAAMSRLAISARSPSP